MVIIACVGVVGWLLLLAITVCLGAAAKRADEIELGMQVHTPGEDTDRHTPMG